jgi:hypothetical protein
VTKDSAQDEHGVDEQAVKADPPGPVDHGREGGMATRELAPELTETDRDDE